MSGGRRTRTRRGTVTITETSLVPQFKRRLAELAGKEVHVGMDGDAELAMVAAVLEFGSTKMNIPSRPFVRIGKRRATALINKLVKAGFQAIAAGNMRPDKLCRDIGETGLAKMEAAFDKMRKPALSPVYARRKGNKKLLIDERHLRDSLTFKVVRKE